MTLYAVEWRKLEKRKDLIKLKKEKHSQNTPKATKTANEQREALPRVPKLLKTQKIFAKKMKTID